MKRLFALLIGLAFVAGTVGVATAQTGGATKTDDKKMDKPADMKADKKMSSKTATGTVKSASADNIVVTGKEKGKDAEWTFAIDDKTKVKKANKDATAKDLTAGDNVVVRYMDHAGKMTASSVTVRAPKKEAAGAKADKTK